MKERMETEKIHEVWRAQKKTPHVEWIIDFMLSTCLCGAAVPKCMWQEAQKSLRTDKINAKR